MSQDRCSTPLFDEAAELKAFKAWLDGYSPEWKKFFTPGEIEPLRHSWFASAKRFTQSETASSVDRWEVNLINRSNDYAELKHRKSQTGRWVTFEDHCRAIERLSKQSAIEQIKHTAGRQRQADADFLYRQAEKGDAIFRRTAEYLADLVSKNTLIDAADRKIDK